MAKSPLDYGVYAQAFIYRDDKLFEKLGSDGVHFFDQRWSRMHMADVAHMWAERNGFDAYQLMITNSGFSNARSLGCMMILNPTALHAKRVA